MTSRTETDRSTRSPFDLQDRTALVTGGASGIGQAIAVALAKAGCDMVLCSDQDNFDETRERIQPLDRVVDTCILDLSRTGNIAVVMEDLLSRHRIDILVNAAGIIRRQRATEFSDENWREVLDVNLTAAFMLSRLVAGPMTARRSGKIINIASMLSFQGGHLVTSYTASKHGLVGLTKAFANECAPSNVQVNALAPGYISTRTTEALRADPVRNAAVLDRIPAGRWGTPEDVSGAAVFLASSASDYVSGHVLAVDGGWLSW